MKKEDKIEKMLEIACIIFSMIVCLYIFISFMSVNSCNLTGAEIPAWNFFTLFFR